jgi:hypothetical protein
LIPLGEAGLARRVPVRIATTWQHGCLIASNRAGRWRGDGARRTSGYECAACGRRAAFVGS